MSLDKAIEHNKEFRKAYTKAKAIDRTCRNHGSCPWCRSKRLYHSSKTSEHSQYDLKNYVHEV